MENYPANSKRPRPSKDENQQLEPKRVERVVQGEVVRRKKPLGRRFAETFLGETAKSVLGSVVMDILIPAAKDMVVDAGQEAIQRMVKGETASTRRHIHRSTGGLNGRVSYDRYYNGSPPMRRDPREDSRPISRRARASHDFDEIILNSRVEAEEVLERLQDIIDKYEQVSVDDLYEMVGVKGDYPDAKYGWYDLRDARVTRVRNSGYLLDLPKPEPLE